MALCRDMRAWRRRGAPLALAGVDPVSVSESQRREFAPPARYPYRTRVYSTCDVLQGALQNLTVFDQSSSKFFSLISLTKFKILSDTRLMTIAFFGSKSDLFIIFSKNSLEFKKTKPFRNLLN